MKKIINIVFSLTAGMLILLNIFIFCSSLKLSDDINNFENKINQLHIENLALEKKVSDLSSLKYAESLAPSLGFTKINMPTYLDKLNVALKY